MSRISSTYKKKPSQSYFHERIYPKKFTNTNKNLKLTNALRALPKIQLPHAHTSSKNTKQQPIILDDFLTSDPIQEAKYRNAITYSPDTELKRLEDDYLGKYKKPAMNPMININRRTHHFENEPDTKSNSKQRHGYHTSYGVTGGKKRHSCRHRRRRRTQKYSASR